jgi:hypothetical protein
MSVLSGVQVIVGIAYVVLAEILWPRIYYRRLDPALRRWLGRAVGVPVVWAYRVDADEDSDGSSMWCWSVGGDGEITSGKCHLVGLAGLLVHMLAGVAPIAVFWLVLNDSRLGPAKGLSYVSVVAYVLLMLMMLVTLRFVLGGHTGAMVLSAARTEPYQTEELVGLTVRRTSASGTDSRA